MICLMFVMYVGSYKVRGYVPSKQLYQFRIAGFEQYTGIAGNHEYKAKLTYPNLTSPTYTFN